MAMTHLFINVPSIVCLYFLWDSDIGKVTYLDTPGSRGVWITDLVHLTAIYWATTLCYWVLISRKLVGLIVVGWLSICCPHLSCEQLVGPASGGLSAMCILSTNR